MRTTQPAAPGPMSPTYAGPGPAGPVATGPNDAEPPAASPGPASGGTGDRTARRRSRAARVVGALANTALGALALAVLVAAMGPIAGWWHYEVVESGSMTPALRVGGVAIVQREQLDQVHTGQILAVHPPGMKTYVRIHRVIAVSRHNGQVWIRTKGDANNTPDPGPIRLLGHGVYHETTFVPYVGYGAVWLYRHSTRVALTVTLFVLVVGGGLYLIWSAGDDDSAAEEKATEEGQPSEVDGSGDDKPVPDLSAGRAAEQAASASLLALNNIYWSGDDAGEAPQASGGPAPGESSAPRRRSRHAG